MRKLDFEKTVWSYLHEFDRYDDILTYNGAHELDEKPRTSLSYVYWKNVEPLSYSFKYVQD